MNTDLYLFIYL